MKLMVWILTGLISITAFGADEFDINDALRNLSTPTGNTASGWPELENFQAALWRAMALDPGPILIVPVDKVPKALLADELTNSLSQQFEKLIPSKIPQTAHAETEFSQYTHTVKKIITDRKNRKFPQSRAFAKNGTLDEQFAKLTAKIQSNGFTDTDGTNVRAESVRKIETYLQNIKDKKTNTDARNAPFTNGNQFIWAALIALIGFVFGITAIKMNPEFFEKHFSDNPAPAATHTNRLNYARWLREFEELLAKLKVTQLTHERRIEEVYKHSERLHHFAAFMNLDSNLKRELQQQLDQANELKTGDRAQIHVTLEHCLKLCDAIENNGVQLPTSPDANC